MNLAMQMSVLPTNKLIVMNALAILTFHFGGSVIPPEVMDAYGFFISLGLGLIGAWFTPDSPNIPMGDDNASQG